MNKIVSILNKGNDKKSESLVLMELPAESPFCLPKKLIICYQFSIDLCGLFTIIDDQTPIIRVRFRSSSKRHQKTQLIEKRFLFDFN